MNGEILQVVSAKLAKDGDIRVKFEGTREECYDYMRTHDDVDLIYKNGRFSSWVLKEIAVNGKDQDTGRYL
jgi:hypothetical protein